MFRHILLTSSIGNAQRTVRRICIFISRLKGLRKLNEMLRVALHWAEGDLLSEATLFSKHIKVNIVLIITL